MKQIIILTFVMMYFQFLNAQKSEKQADNYCFIAEIAPNLGVGKYDDQFKADFNFINAMQFPSTNTLGLGIGANYDFTDFVYVPLFADVRLKFNKDKMITPLIVIDGGVVVYDSDDSYKTSGFYKLGFGFESRAPKRPIQLYIGYKGERTEVIDMYSFKSNGFISSIKKKKTNMPYINLNFSMLF